MSYGSTSGNSTPSRRVRLSAPPPPPVKYEGHATVRSSVTNLANTVIGAGALAFPSAFASMGLIPGIISCAFSACATAFGLYLLSRCATEVGKRPGDEGRRASFNEVARLTFGKGWAIRLFDLAIAIKCFGVSVSYLIVCKTLLPQVSFTIGKSINHPLADDSLLLSQDFWLIISMLVIIPLSFLRTLDALRFTSQIALGMVGYLIIVVVGWFIVKGHSPTRGEVVLGRFGKNTLSSFPVQVFAYTCAQNIFPIYNELQNNTQKRMNTVILTSIGGAAACYEVLGNVGYLTFGSKVGSNIIAMYPATSLIIAIGRFGIVLLVGLSYPLQLLPCRVCIHTLTRGLIKRKKELPVDASASAIQRAIAEEDEEEEDPLMPDREPPKDVTPRRTRPKGEMKMNKFIIITIIILVSGFFIALAVDELEVVLGFVGSTGSTILSFILPGFFYFNLFRQEKGPIKWAALALGIYGLAVMGFCLTFNILNLERRKAPSGQ